MDSAESLPLRDYVGMIWVGEQPGIRLRIEARTLDDAEAAVLAEYGEGHIFSIWNEEDAAKPR